MILILPPDLRDAIAAAARAAFPRECCGLIEGVWRGEAAEAVVLHPAPDGGAGDFAIDPALHFSVQRDARNRGHTIIGCYHSHPHGAARPSQADRAGAGQTDFIWVIAALAGTAVELRAFVYRASDFSEIGVATGADLVTSSSNTRY